jgi:Sigma-54 interaction domain
LKRATESRMRTEIKFQSAFRLQFGPKNLHKESGKVLSDSVIAMRGQGGNSPCRSYTAPSSTTKITGLESYVALDQNLESQRDARESRSGFEGFVGSSAALGEVLDQTRTVAPTDTTVLIEGETGTGKELIAQAVHTNSQRREPCSTRRHASVGAGLQMDAHGPGNPRGTVEAEREKRSDPSHRSAAGRGSICG